MSRTTARRILQLLPAPGWVAAYRGANAVLYYTPIACWALVAERKSGVQAIVGVEPHDGVMDFCDAVENFQGYYHETETQAALPSAEEAG
jgi:hypothetical protein